MSLGGFNLAGKSSRLTSLLRRADALTGRRILRDSLEPTASAPFMTTPFFLIDFENVQPKALGRLQPGAARIKVFLGQNQSKLMLELVQALQPFGKDAEYIQITGSGPDAVDFHIAFYIGRLASAHPGAAFTIISKDRGFDPLVRHLESLGIACRRLAEIPGSAVPPTVKAKAVKQAAAAKKAAKKFIVTVDPPTPVLVAKPATAISMPKGVPSTATTTRSRAAQVVAWLQKSSRPATLAKLRTSIRARFNPPLDDKQVDAVVQSLQGSKKIAVTGSKVAYTL